VNLLISSRNAHKCEEIRALLPSAIHLFTLKDFPSAPEVVEDANTFSGNATKKGVHLARWMAANPALVAHVMGQGSHRDLMVLADDSGLEVDALNGAPGVHSARFAAMESGVAGNSPDAANNAKLLGLLKESPWETRTARFRCVIALTPAVPAHSQNRSPVCDADELELQTELFEGSCEGRIRFELRGARGFGYDPLFVPDGFEQTFAELGEEIKNRISHRAKALEKLRQKLLSWFGPSHR